MAPHSSTLAWKIPWTKGIAWWAAVHGVAKSRTQLSDFPFTFHFHALEKKWQPSPVFLPGESQGRGSLVGCRLWGRTESGTTEATRQRYRRLASAYAVLSLQSCPTLCDPMDSSPPGSSVHGILQARILEWIAMPSSRRSS